MKGRRFILYWIFLLLASCLEPYQAPETKTNINALVVDGFLNLADNSATVRLSRTTKLSDKAASAVERLATVKLEDMSTGLLTTIPETQQGLYTISGLSLSVSKKYRLHIQTTQAKTYLSDDISLKIAPPIDSVYWEAESDGAHIYLATHDPTNNSGYYLWDYVETWQHTAFFDAFYRVQGGKIVMRPYSERTFICWSTSNSSNISLGSSKKLNQDIITKAPILVIPKGSRKIVLNYSVIVQQQVLTEESFLFWQKLQKTTQNIGGLYDPLPSQITGNIHNVNDPLEPVMGYFAGGSMTTKRIFISAPDLPRYLVGTQFFVGECRNDTLKGDLKMYEGVLLTTESPPITAAGHCIDCRLDGGTTVKPDFWP